jgi:DNA-binding SARP family transcriptional activator/tetratricopeptide (TPR) repeat protein
MMVGISVESRPPRSQPEEAAPPLAIRLLGEVQIQRSGVTVTLPASKRTRALLGFLVATATPQPRQALCDLLWDGPDDPRAALRWSLTKLRPLLNEAGVERLISDREHVLFTPHGARVDLQRLDLLLQGDPAAARIAEIEEAAALLQGEFLDGLDLPSCYRFHHWCLAERERWGLLRGRVLTLAVERSREDPNRGLLYARALVAADPLSEASHAKLVGLLATLGRHKDAQEHYFYARKMLQREMGAPLQGDLKPPRLPVRGQSLETGDEMVTAPITSVSSPTPANAPGLVGRVAEQEAIVASLDRLSADSAVGAMLFLGEPGIGKSRLLKFVAEQAAQRGARVVAARCFEVEAVRPYGCWTDALGSIIEETADASALPDLSRFLPSHETAMNNGRNRQFAAVTTLLLSAAAQRPLVIIIDDLQWIDEGSSSLLHYVLRASRRHAHFWFVGSARADDIDDNPWCRRLVSALLQDDTVKRIKLTPFRAEEAAQIFGSDPTDSDVAIALKLSGGNPLFLTELAKAGRQGLQSLARNLEGLIADRVARLSDAERELIVFAAATARDFRPELLGAAMGLSELQLLERIESLERRALLKPGTDGRFDFAHDLIRQATYRGLSQPRRRLIHRQFARALAEAAHSDQTLAGELAYHAGAAADHPLAVHASIAAGDHCLRLFANAAAINAADRGLGHLALMPIGPDRAHCHIALLKVKVFASATPGIWIKPKLLEELQQAVEAAELMGLRDDAALGWHMISWLTQRSNDAIGAQQAILRAEEMSRPTDEPTRCQLLAHTGRCLLEVEGDIERARTYLRDANRLAATVCQNFVELDWGLGLLARWDGHLAKAQESMRRALTLARLREDRWREIECLVWMAKIAIESGRTGEVDAYCDAMDVVAKRTGGGPAPVADALRAVAIMHDQPGAEPQLPPKLKALRLLDDKAQLAYVLNEIATCRLRCGNVEGARAAAAEALVAAQAVKRSTEIIAATSNLVCIEVVAGNPQEAEQFGISLAAATETGSFLSARAQAHLSRARERFKIPTGIQTTTT